jgi:hypothetical protein
MAQVPTRPGRVPGGVPKFLAQPPSTPIPPGTFLPPVTGSVSGVDTSTVLLMHADGTNGSTTFTDASSYARPLTAVNGAQVGTASPKFGSGAADFTASNTTYINVGNASDFNFGLQQFTIEAWGYFTSFNSSDVDPILGQWTTPGFNFIFIIVSSRLEFHYTTDGTTGTQIVVGAAFTPTINTWYHFAVDRDATGTTRIYVNGAVIASATVPALPIVGNVSTQIGNNSDYDFQSFTGYLDEVRVSVGIARYAGAFTPPAAPFTISAPLAQADQTLSAAGTVLTPIGGTLGPVPIASPSCVLLAHMDGASGSTTFIDSSPSKHTLTGTDVQILPAGFGKFGGCADFTYAGDSAIDTGNATDFQFGAGQFTIEVWCYLTASASSSPDIISQWNWSGPTLGLWLDTTSIKFNWSVSGSNNLSAYGAYTPPLNTWFHVAIDRDASSTLRIYANGTVIYSSSVTDTFFASTYNCIIGNDYSFSHAFPGYFDEVRVTKGRAMYAGAFTPATQPFSAPNTVLLAHMDGAIGSTTFIDSSLNANTLTSIGVAQINISPAKFNGYARFPFSASAIDCGSNTTDFNFGAGPFTIEAWCYFISAPSSFSTFLSQGTGGGGTNDGWLFGINTNGPRFLYAPTGSGYTAVNTLGYTLPLSTWIHFAVDRDVSNVIRIYADGAVVASSTVTSTIYPSTLDCYVGNTYDAAFQMPGYMDEVRVTKGLAQYGGAFTPPTQAFLPGYTTGLTQADQTLSAALAPPLPSPAPWPSPRQRRP